MDENGTRFHLILGKGDWQRQIVGVDNLDLDHERDMITLHPLDFRFPTPPGDRVPDREDRRGAGQDRYGNWYWIDENRTAIQYMPARGREAQHFWSSLDVSEEWQALENGGDFKPKPAALPGSLLLSGLAVTGYHYLIVGVIDPAGLLIFDLHGGGPPIQMLWPENVPFAPFDMAPAPGGGVWIMDDEPRYWALDRYFRVVTGETASAAEPTTTAAFVPKDGESLPRRPAHGPVTLNHAFPVAGSHVMAITGLPDGSVLIMESDPAKTYSVLRRYRFGSQIGEDFDLVRVLRIAGSGDGPSIDADLWGHEMAFLADISVSTDEVRGTLIIVAADGNQAYDFDFQATEDTWEIDSLPHYLPMRRYSGAAVVAGNKSVSYHTERNRWQTLVCVPRPRFEPSATFSTEIFDGKEPDCIWHRLFLDAIIPPGARVTIESRAANSEATLAATQWDLEPSLYRRSTGTEIPYYRAFDEETAAQEGAGTWETLFQSAVGRYLQLRITLRGTGRATPRLHSLRIYYPRFSYLQEYLPAVYGLDTTSASFMDRFLANMEGTFSEIEGCIAQAQTQFDVDTIHTEYLGWLASWFGVALDTSWDELRQRLFLSHAMEMFNQRGTPSGLIRAIRLAMDPCPDETLFEENVLGRCSNGDCVQIVNRSVRIVERYLTRSVPGVVYGDPTDNIQPRRVSKDKVWAAADGSEPLHARYREFLQRIYQTEEEGLSGLDALNSAWGDPPYSDFAAITFSPVLPSNPAKASDWNQFRESELGFTYAVVAAPKSSVETSEQTAGETVPSNGTTAAMHLLDEEIYQAFLARRYRQVSALNEAYQRQGGNAWSSFSKVPLPAEDAMPAGGDELEDWIQFVSLVIPIARSAHWFTVLIPTDTRTDDLAVLEQRVAQVKRIVDIEKPAHTNFEVKPYWALFRVGEARLGHDTLLDEGSRFVSLLLGHSYLAESYIAPEEPWNVIDRLVVGRDQLGHRIEVQE